MICFDQGLQVFPKKGELGGRRQPLRRRRNHSNLYMIVYQTLFRTRSANWFPSHVNAVIMCTVTTVVLVKCGVLSKYWFPSHFWRRRLTWFENMQVNICCDQYSPLKLLIRTGCAGGFCAQWQLQFKLSVGYFRNIGSQAILEVEIDLVLEYVGESVL